MHRISIALGAVAWSTSLVAAQSPIQGFPPGVFQSRAALDAAAASYTGPGDVVSGATTFYGLRGYNAAYATGSNKAVSLRRASDNTTCDFNIASSGSLGNSNSGCSLGGGLTLSTFATQDATASCTISTTTATCTGASSTPTAGDTITGTGVTQPCYAVSVGTFTGGAGTVTVGGNGASSPCGTVGVAVTLTFQVALFITKLYDQSGANSCASAACDLLQATAAAQPQLFPLCPTLACISYNSTGHELATASNYVGSIQPFTISYVGESTGRFTSNNCVFGSSSANTQAGFGNTANKVYIFASTSAPTATASNSAFHAIQNIFNGGSLASTINVDGAATAVSTGTTAVSAATTLSTGFLCGNALLGNIYEFGLWASGFNPTQQGNMHTNQSAYWGTP